MTVRVIPVVDAPWDDVRAVFGTRGDPSTCWCQFFKVDNATWNRTDPATFERALCEQTQAGGAGPGLIAYDDETPVGWVAIEPRPAYVRTVNRGADRTEDPAAPDIWVVSCFVVRVGHRRKGVSRALLDAAVVHARANGAHAIEAFPVVAGPTTSSADLYHGAYSAFEAAGFETVARTSERRAVVRLEV